MSRSAAFPSVPPERRVYAIGDIHGRLDLLDEVLDRIDRDAASRTDAACTIVFLGDYIDRGPDAASVIARLIESASFYEMVFLKGNHEQLLLRFLDEPTILPFWASVGGLATLQSYGVPICSTPSLLQCEAVSKSFKKFLPDDHLAHLKACRLTCVIGDYLFVHAGVRPDRPLQDQQENDLLWIRNQFTDSKLLFDKFIVHGHTSVFNPDVQSNRINIDTGAHATGKLTCLALEGSFGYFL